MLAVRPERDGAVVRQRKEWAVDSLAISENPVVRIFELQCFDQGCPPLETVIVEMEQGEDTRQWKLHKAIPDVSRNDIIELAATDTPAGSKLTYFFH